MTPGLSATLSDILERLDRAVERTWSSDLEGARHDVLIAREEVLAVIDALSTPANVASRGIRPMPSQVR